MLNNLPLLSFAPVLCLLDLQFDSYSQMLSLIVACRKSVYIFLFFLTCIICRTSFISFSTSAASSVCLPSFWRVPSCLFKVWLILAIVASVVSYTYLRDSLNCMTPNMSMLTSSCIEASSSILLVFLTGPICTALETQAKQSRQRPQINLMISVTYKLTVVQLFVRLKSL